MLTWTLIEEIDVTELIGFLTYDNRYCWKSHKIQLYSSVYIRYSVYVIIVIKILLYEQKRKIAFLHGSVPEIYVSLVLLSAVFLATTWFRCVLTHSRSYNLLKKCVTFIWFVYLMCRTLNIIASVVLLVYYPMILNDLSILWIFLDWVRSHRTEKIHLTGWSDW
jgi:integral membrane sensor domain MASE1